MKRLVTLSLILTLLFPLANAREDYGQETTESTGLTGELMRFAGNIHQFNNIFPQEKVFIQFDNTSYYTGETIWFKAFVVNASTLKRAQSKVLYVDLVSPNGVVLKQQKLKIVAGQADGSFPLLDGSTEQAREKRGVLEYPSGFYEVRAYTSYMLNFNEEAVFSRVFAVYEKPQKEGNYYAETPTIKIRKYETTEELRPKADKLRKINCEFYPEGGHMIMGKPCRVAFKVTDDTGFGVDASGILDDTDIAFGTVHNGMGWFTFTPTERKNTATITVDGQSKTFSLPVPEQRGLALQVDATKSDDILMRLDCTPDLVGATLGMSLTCRGELVDFCTIETGEQPVEKAISMAGVPEGVCRVYVFGSDGNIYASRSVYHNSKEITRPTIEAYTDKDKYGPFEKVGLKFNLKDGRGNPFRDRFCLSVRDVRGQGNAFVDDLRTSLLLSSDLKGLIETPSWYFDSDDPERNLALDLLMLVQGWERYDWLTMTGQKEFKEKHRLEENLTVNGWVMNSSGNKTMGDIEVTAAVMPQDKTLTETYSYKTDSSGYFGFDIGPEFYGKAQFSIGTHVDRKRIIGPDARIVFDRSLSPAIRAYMPQELVFTGLQSAKKSGRKGTGSQEDEPESLISQDNGIVLPDVDIEEDRMYVDYFTFKAYDVVKDVEMELDKGDYSTDLQGYLLEHGYAVDVICVDTEQGTVFINVLVNGFEPFFYVHDSKKYKDSGIFEDSPLTRLAIDSKDIKSIIIFDRPMYMHDVISQSPLYVQSPQYQIFMDSAISSPNYFEIMNKRMLLIDVQVKEPQDLSTRKEIFEINKRVTTVDGYSRPYEFYSPEYPNGPVPGDVDYRRTLYWNPNVITDSIGNAQVEFYNNSISTHFNVSAAGITASGIPYILNQNW